MFPSFTAVASDDILSSFALENSPSDISQNQAYALMEKDAVVVIDVRTAEEYANTHIEGAYSMPLDTLLQNEQLPLLKENDTPVLVYCRSGRRSGLAMHNMSKAGYKNVFNMGGINTWEYGTTTEAPAKSFEQAIKDVKPLK